MPQHKTHLFIGFLTYSVVLYIALFLGNLALARKIELLIYALMGSLFPDIDTKSKIQRMMYCIFFVLLASCAYMRCYVAITALSLFICVPIIVHHRSLFHSILFLVCLGLLVIAGTYYYFSSYVSYMTYNLIFFLSGSISHIIADRGRFKPKFLKRKNYTR